MNSRKGSVCSELLWTAAVATTALTAKDFFTGRDPAMEAVAKLIADAPRREAAVAAARRSAPGG